MTTKVCIFHPSDPVGTIPGGIDTFIRGILRWAPDDISVSLVGVTTDPAARPPGKWTECDLGRRRFNFYPVITLSDPGGRTRIPLTVRYSTALAFKKFDKDFDVLEFHRIEPSLFFYTSDRPKSIFVHSNMEILYNKKSDILWRRFPWLFFKMEDWLLPRIQSVFSVREDAVEAYQKRFPLIADRFHFVPTWVDPDVFYPISENNRAKLKARLGKIYKFESHNDLLVSVGRLDLVKNPILLLDAFARVAKVAPDTRLVVVGDGVLRKKIVAHIEKLNLHDRVILVGLRSAAEIADLLRVSSVFVLSSAYEGMPMCVLEALGCGLPTAVTDVGELRRIIKPGINGEIAKEHSPDSLASAILSCINHRDRYGGKPCLDVALRYTPSIVLEPVYRNYRRLAGLSRK